MAVLDSLLALVEAEFQLASKRVDEAKNEIARYGNAREALAYLAVKHLIADMKLKHYSDCALHNEPAYPISKCDCGGYSGNRGAE